MLRHSLPRAQAPNLKMGPPAELDAGELAQEVTMSQQEPTQQTKELQFRKSHALLLAFLFLMVIVQGLGIYLFTNGFLLTRLVLDHKSECHVPPAQMDQAHPCGSAVTGCWHPRSFKKAVVLIIDALRYDFTIPMHESPHHHHNAIPLLYDIASTRPNHAFLRPFIADPPTTTLQRLKGLTTGTLPTFVEAGSNFAGNAIEEDNLVSQLNDAGKNVVQLGDDTWQKLFPGHFDMNLTIPFDSFNVKDIHTVDDGVITHLMPLLHPSNATTWDVIFGHFLGVDHVGHNKGPDDPIMTTKLRQMNDVLAQTVSLIDDDTVLIVLGDHGMDSKGNHGGESDDEIEAALWMYSKRPFFGRSDPAFEAPPLTAKQRPIAQIDLVPTLALLLGLPIPFNNLGAPIEEAFIGTSGNQWQNMARVHRLAASQIRRFQGEYALVRAPDAIAAAVPEAAWQMALHEWDEMADSELTLEQWRALSTSFLCYQVRILTMFKSLWASFDLVSMALGISVLLLAVIVVTLYARNPVHNIGNLHRRLCISGISALCLGGLAGYALVPTGETLRSTVSAAAFSCCLALLLTLSLTERSLKNAFALPHGIWSWISFLSIFLLAAGFGSNSYTVWEEETLLFMLAAFGTLLLAQAFRLPNASDRLFCAYHALLFMAVLRLCAIARVCREEQLPNCDPLFYASGSSTSSAGWRMALPWIVALVLPTALKAFYDQTGSYHASAPFWIGIGLRATLYLIASYWSLEAFRALAGAWLSLSEDMVELIRTWIARLILAIAIVAGGATFAWQAPPINVQVAPDTDKPGEPQERPTKSDDAAITVAPTRATTGGTNIYGAHFAMLPFTVLLIPLLLVSKPMGQMALLCTTVAILSLVNLLHPPGQQHASSANKISPVGPTVLALLAHFLYFKTGHQAALASIQWEMAFVVSRTLRYPWSPLLMVLNTFAAQILCAAAVPLVVLWRRPHALPHPSRRAPGTSPARHAAAHAERRERARDSLLADLGRAQLLHVLAYSAINLATTAFAAHLRRHLMLYRVFLPRWMLGGVGMVVAELAGCLIGVAGAGWTVASVERLWGW